MYIFGNDETIAMTFLTKYMINQGMDIKPLPKLKLINNIFKTFLYLFFILIK